MAKLINKITVFVKELKQNVIMKTTGRYKGDVNREKCFVHHWV